MNEPDPEQDVQSTLHQEPERFTIAQAATLLGTSRDAIRQRIRRGTLRSEKAAGKWYVYLREEPGGTEASRTDGLNNQTSDHPGTVQSATLYEDLYRQLTDQLRGEVNFLREELRRKDQLLAGFAQRLPALDVPRTSTQPTDDSAPSDGIAARVALSTSEPIATPGPSRASWWKFWRRQ